jgi:hypothetical protein
LAAEKAAVLDEEGEVGGRPRGVKGWLSKKKEKVSEFSHMWTDAWQRSEERRDAWGMV